MTTKIPHSIPPLPPQVLSSHLQRLPHELLLGVFAFLKPPDQKSLSLTPALSHLHLSNPLLLERIKNIWEAIAIGSAHFWGLWNTVDSAKKEVFIESITSAGVNLVARKEDGSHYRLLPSSEREKVLKEANGDLSILTIKPKKEFYHNAAGALLYVDEHGLLHFQHETPDLSFITLFLQDKPFAVKINSMHILSPAPNEQIVLCADDCLYLLSSHQNFQMKFQSKELEEKTIRSYISHNANVFTLKVYNHDTSQEETLSLKYSGLNSITLNKEEISSISYDSNNHDFYIYHKKSVHYIHLAFKSNVFSTLERFDFANTLGEREIVKGLGKVGPYFVFEVITPILTEPYCILLHQLGDGIGGETLQRRERTLIEMCQLGDGVDNAKEETTLQAVAVVDNYIALSHKQGPKLYRYRTDGTLLYPYIDRLRVVNVWLDVWDFYQKNRNTIAFDPAVGKFLETFKALRQDLNKPMNWDNHSENSLLQVLNLQDSSTGEKRAPKEIQKDIALIINFLQERNIHPLPWESKFEPISRARFAQYFENLSLTLQVLQFHVSGHFLLIHARTEDSHYESIYFYDLVTESLKTLNLKEHHHNDHKHPPIQAICGVGLQMRMEPEYIFISASSSLGYLLPENPQVVQFESNEFIANLELEILFSGDLRDKINKADIWKNLPMNYNIVDLRFVDSPLLDNEGNKVGEQIHIAVLIGNGGKHEVIVFDKQNRTNNEDSIQVQTPIAPSAPKQHFKSSLQVFKGTHEAEARGALPTTEAPVSSTEEEPKLITIERSQKIRWAATTFTVLTVGMALITAVAALGTAASLIPAFKAIVIIGFSLNISLLILATSASSLLVLTAITSILWFYEWKKSLAHKNLEAEVSANLA